MLQRSNQVSKIRYEFSTRFESCLEALECSWSDWGFILNQVDAYWLTAARRELSMEQACANWAMHNTSALDFSEQINQAGSHLVELIQSHKLSHAEVNLIIVSTRQSGCKWQLRDEQGTPGKES